MSVAGQAMDPAMNAGLFSVFQNKFWTENKILHVLWRTKYSSIFFTICQGFCQPRTFSRLRSRGFLILSRKGAASIIRSSLLIEALSRRPLGSGLRSRLWRASELHVLKFLFVPPTHPPTVPSGSTVSSSSSTCKIGIR